MGAKTQSLIQILDSLVVLLRQYGVERWASWVESDRNRLQAGDFGGIRHLLSAFGGMGSLGDLMLHPANGHPLSLAEADRVNTRLQDLTSRAYSLADEISREAVFDQ